MINETKTYLIPEGTSKCILHVSAHTHTKNTKHCNNEKEGKCQKEKEQTEKRRKLSKWGVIMAQEL